MNNRFFLVTLGLKLSALTSKNRFITLTSRLATIGIMLGVSTLITVLAVMRGFENEIRHSLIHEYDHLQVYSFNDYYPSELYEEIRALPHVVSVTGVVKSYGLIRAFKQYIPVMLMSFEDMTEQMGLPDIEDGGVYLSKHHTLYYEEGDEVGLILPQVDKLKPKSVNARYMGNYGSQVAAKGVMLGLVSFPTYQSMTGSDQLSGLSVVVDDLYATSDIKSYLSKRYGGMYQGFDWKDKYQPLFSALRMQRALMVFILSMITLVAMFSLVSGLVMLSSDLREEIAVLRTMGLSRKRLMNIFLVQGMFISTIGVMLGVILAIVLCYFAQDIASFLEYIIGAQLIDERIYGTAKLPTDLDTVLIAWVALSALLLGLIASIYPARKAMSVDPAMVLRYV